MSNITSLVSDYVSQPDHLASIYKQINHHQTIGSNEINRIYGNQRFINTLIDEYKEWGNIIVAYDFDDTVKPLYSPEPCDLVVELLQVCSKLDFRMVCYTARSSNSDIEYVKNALNELCIRYDSINVEHPAAIRKNVIEYPTKLLYSIFLDDKAGLKQSYEVLWGFIDWYLHQDIKILQKQRI